MRKLLYLTLFKTSLCQIVQERPLINIIITQSGFTTTVQYFSTHFPYRTVANFSIRINYSDFDFDFSFYKCIQKPSKYGFEFDKHSGTWPGANMLYLQGKLSPLSSALYQKHTLNVRGSAQILKYFRIHLKQRSEKFHLVLRRAPFRTDLVIFNINRNSTYS